MSLPSAQIETMGLVLLIFAGMACFSLKQNIWVLVALTLLLSGTMNILPGNLELRYFLIPVAVGFLALRFTVGARDLDIRLGILDFLILLQIACVAQAFLRNPIGMSFLGSAEIGGKHYLQFGLSVVGYYLLSAVKCDLSTYSKIVLGMLALAFLESIYTVFCGALPELGYFFESVYGAGVSLQFYDEEQDISVSRLAYFAYLADIAMLISCTLWPPLTGVNPFRPIRFALFIMTGVSVLISGFRSRIVYWACLFVASSIAWRRKSHVVIAGLLGSMGLIVLIGFASVTKLPESVQRSLSFLPGVEVDSGVGQSAEGSIDWRVEMWELALSSDRYIKNKLLGDGFGMSAAEHELAQDERLGLVTHNDYSGIEYFMAKGSYHGFHVETIRFTGVVGLIVATVLLVYLAKVSVGLNRYFYGRQEFGTVLVVTVPMTIYWFYYWVVYGSYKSPNGFPLIILLAGMVKLLMKIREDEQRDAVLVGEDELEGAEGEKS